MTSRDGTEPRCNTVVATWSICYCFCFCRSIPSTGPGPAAPKHIRSNHADQQQHDLGNQQQNARGSYNATKPAIEHPPRPDRSGNIHRIRLTDNLHHDQPGVVSRMLQRDTSGLVRSSRFTYRIAAARRRSSTGRPRRHRTASNDAASQRNQQISARRKLTQATSPASASSSGPAAPACPGMQKARN